MRIIQGATDERAKATDSIDIRPSLEDSNRKRQGRGRGRAAGRGRGSKATDQIRSLSNSSTVSSNGQLEKLSLKVCILRHL